MIGAAHFSLQSAAIKLACSLRRHSLSTHHSRIMQTMSPHALLDTFVERGFSNGLKPIACIDSPYEQQPFFRHSDSCELIGDPLAPRVTPKFNNAIKDVSGRKDG